MASVLEVDVVLIGPEVGDLRVRLVPARDRRRYAATLVLRDLPVLDADGTAQHRVLVQGHVAAHVNVLGGSQSFVDADTAAFDRQPKTAGQVEGTLHSNRDEHQVRLFILTAGERDAGHSIAVRMPRLDLLVGADLDALVPADPGRDLSDLPAQRP